MSEFVYDAKVAARYDQAVPLQRGEVDFYLELARAAQARGLPTLELACGTGRVAVPLAQADASLQITGLDVSPDMLALAREKSRALDNLTWLEGDMRAFDLGQQFGLIFIAVGSFQLLLEIDDQLACLRAVRAHLAPEGRLAFEVENPNLVAMAEWLTTKAGTYQRNPARDFTDAASGHRIESWGSAEYHPSAQQRVGRSFTEAIDDAGLVVRREHGKPMTLRYFHRYEVEHLLARAGLAVEALYGDLGRGAYRATSPDLIWIARRDDA